jgi:hypothetical protein
MTLLTARSLFKAALMLLTYAALSGPAAAAGCDRECLKGHMDRYLDALVKHDASALPLAASYQAIYNGKPTKFDTDEWRLIDAIAFRQYVVDTKAGQVAFFGVAVENFKRGTLFVRLEVKDQKLATIETITGERTTDGVPGMISPNPFYEYVLPPEHRRTREQLVAIADSYFEGLEKHDGKNTPVSDDCRRFEDGVQTSLNPVFLPIACNVFTPFAYIAKTANRLYPVVDEERGLVLGQMVIEVPKILPPSSPPPAANPAKPPVNPLTGMVMPPNDWRGKPHDTIIHELFKVVDGKITEIQTIRLDRPLGWGGGW